MKVIRFWSPLFFLTLLLIFPLQNQAQRLPKIVKRNYAFIPAGSIQTETMTVESSSFYIAKDEITCKEYKEFQKAMQAKNNPDILKIIALDTSVWPGNIYYASTYGVHPAFDNYPIVAISRAAAELYCQWLTEQWGQGAVAFRLPTRNEWMRAAQGKNPGAAYAWGKNKMDGNFLTNQKGRYACNFADWYGLENLHRNDTTQAYSVAGKTSFRDGFAYTSYSRYFPANYFGLHDMCGNVAEMVQESGIAVGGSWKTAGYDVRIESTKAFTQASGDVGFRPVMVRKN